MNMRKVNFEGGMLMALISMPALAFIAWANWRILVIVLAILAAAAGWIFCCWKLSAWAARKVFGE